MSSAIGESTFAASSKPLPTVTPNRPNATTTPTFAFGKDKRATCPWKSAAPIAVRWGSCLTINGLRNWTNGFWQRSDNWELGISN